METYHLDYLSAECRNLYDNIPLVFNSYGKTFGALYRNFSDECIFIWWNYCFCGLCYFGICSDTIMFWSRLSGSVVKLLHSVVHFYGACIMYAGSKRASVWYFTGKNEIISSIIIYLLGIFQKRKQLQMQL